MEWSEYNLSTQMKGQITRGSRLGEAIYNITKQDDVQTIVDIGTWWGGGSIRCIYDGIINSEKKDYLVLSIECNKERYMHALKNFPEIHNFFFIYGSLISATELKKIISSKPLTEEQLRWATEDIDNTYNCPIIEPYYLPSHIDLCVMDGGEFTGKQEWELLAINSPTYVVLDDTVSKHKETRDYIINDNERFIVLEDNTKDRNGWLIYKNKHGLY